jgi:catechol 2,3-dioxygenase-like lactoylglutathione lyase family enzyme
MRHSAKPERRIRASSSIPQPAGAARENPIILTRLQTRNRDGAVLHLSSHAGDGVIGGVVYFTSGDVDGLHEEFVAKNVRIHIAPVDQTWGMRELYVRDPDGNSVRFGAPAAA